jgi:hypothetical protein
MHVTSVLYYVAVLLLIALVANHLGTFLRRRRRTRTNRNNPAVAAQQTIEETHLMRVLACTADVGMFHQMRQAHGFAVVSPELKEGTPELAVDVSLGILKSTRESERRLSKAEAEELLKVLRDELAMPPTDQTPGEMIRCIRARLTRLVELTAEAQLSICDLGCRVTDIESVVRQLPKVLENQRRAIMTHDEIIMELKRDSATKADLTTLQKELDVVKWAFTLILGILLAVVGWLMKAM